VLWGARTLAAMNELTAPDLQTVLTFVPSLALAIGLAASAGLRAWLPLLATSVLARLDVLQLGDSFAFMSSTPAIVLFAIATVLEIVADKVPALDHGLDAISTVVRPLAATLLAGSVMFQIHDPLWALALGLMVGAPTALVPHAAKSGVRVASSATTAGVGNPVLSVAEDASAVGMIALAVVVPVVAAVAVIVVGVFAVRWWLRRRAPSAP
jgi:hypothetical protein